MANLKNFQRLLELYYCCCWLWMLSLKPQPKIWFYHLRMCVYMLGKLAARGDFEGDFTPQIPKRKMKQKKKPYSSQYHVK